MCNAILAGLGAATTSTGAAATTATAAAKTYVPPVDNTPPVLKLLGTGAAAITASGAAIVMDNVTWRSTWTDPGAVAYDAVDGNLTANISAFGAGESAQCS